MCESISKLIIKFKVFLQHKQHDIGQQFNLNI